VEGDCEELGENFSHVASTQHEGFFQQEEQSAGAVEDTLFG
jgi:hypothetical protein